MTKLSPDTIKNIRSAADLIRQSKETVVLTGAGISTPSGIPDFRSMDSGLWERYDPFEVASLNAFRYQPERFFAWMRPLAVDMYGAKPNAAHIGLVKLELAGYLTTIITQNIDGLHQRAGSENVIEVHGSLETLTCVSCFRQYGPDGYLEAYLEKGTIPLCKKCSNILKPGVVLMGEELPIEAWLKAQEACNICDLMIVAGSSLEVVPVANLPMRAVENGAHIIVINLSETYINVRADVVFLEDVAEIIPHMANYVLGE